MQQALSTGLYRQSMCLVTEFKRRIKAALHRIAPLFRQELKGPQETALTLLNQKRAQ